MPLYAFGSNGSGQLGIGHDEDVSVPTRCLFEDSEPCLTLGTNTDTNTDTESTHISSPSSSSSSPSPSSSPPSASSITRIAAGGNHTLILFASGAVYSSGLNPDGRCGHPPSPSPIQRFRRVIVRDPGSGAVISKFADVSATWEGSTLVAEGGERVFSVGSGMKGELGLGGGCVRAGEAALVSASGAGFPPPGKKVLSVTGGVGHTVVVLDSGEVYGWGGGRKGSLEMGMGGRLPCGREFTVVTGDKKKGEGVPDPMGPFGGLGASWHGVYVQREHGGVVAWGRNDRGQLPPPGMGVVRGLAVGSEHVLVLIDGRTVMAFGWGEHGNCGPVTDERGNVDGAVVVGVGAGCATSWIVTR
ncbi:RCC1/BLIP-II protein [Aspergillus heteromorphus CBS 117.55]|uniref:RCC1/BLIP-II protein n=1 Tax=Aspergillus heteromorphus CBS 117.55 TaxID=1448321 RepID=A0A317VKF0_9EURO|nr:RCC1/BLIP-II protein [Aspergillus heteromorphus CBS 117.55]PWY73647.1 RCC1/BLIP-II protein [Aspergillus heteromorphus CBS 117.55]